MVTFGAGGPGTSVYFRDPDGSLLSSSRMGRERILTRRELNRALLNGSCSWNGSLSVR
jgi:hypothetical protein